MAGLNIVEKVIALEAVELFAGLTPEELARIAAISTERSVGEDKILLKADEPAAELSVVLEGGVELRRGGDVLHVARQSEVIGAWALFDRDPIQIDARTVEPTRLLRVGRDDFFDLLSDNPDITAALFATLVKRFRKLVEQ